MLLTFATVEYLGEDAKAWAQKVGIILAFAIAVFLVSFFRFGRYK